LAGPAFEFVEHTADIAARLNAPTLAGLFEAAAWAFTEAVTNRGTVRAVMSRTIVLDAPDLELLLVDWLQELLFLFETEELLVAGARVEIAADRPCRLRAIVQGERRDPARHGLKLLIKAVTYHGLQVEQTEEGYVATVVFDI
jgi:SHS2 domain-containing protein